MSRPDHKAREHEPWRRTEERRARLPQLPEERARRGLRLRRLASLGLAVVCFGLYVGRDPMLAWCGHAETCRTRGELAIGVGFALAMFAALFLLLYVDDPPPQGGP